MDTREDCTNRWREINEKLFKSHDLKERQELGEQLKACETRELEIVIQGYVDYGWTKQDLAEMIDACGYLDLETCLTMTEDELRLMLAQRDTGLEPAYVL